MRNLLLLSTVIVFFTSCAPTIYQVSKVQSDNVNKIDTTYVYKDSTFIIDYNFWSRGGQMYFKIYNNSDVPIYIDWNKSNFILNGQSVDYWQDEEITKGVGIGGSYTIGRVSVGRSAYISDVRKEKPNSQIPPHSYIIVDRFAINAPFDLLPKYPKTNKETTTECIQSGTPIEFRNYIAYTKNQDLTNLKFINNDFRVSEVTTINTDFSMYPYLKEKFRKEYSAHNAFYVYSSVRQSELKKDNTIPPTPETKSQKTVSTIIGVTFVMAIILFLTVETSH